MSEGTGISREGRREQVGAVTSPLGWRDGAAQPPAVAPCSG